MWLQHWLQNEFRGIAVVVSHDHCFLSDICTDVLELRAKSSKHGGMISHFSGDFESYQISVAERKIAASREREALSIKKEKLQISIGKEGKKIDQSQKKSKIKKLEELGKQSLEIEEFDEEVQASIQLPSPASSFDPFEKLVRIENVTFAYSDDPSSTLFEGADMCIIPNSRICICGKNGSG